MTLNSFVAEYPSILRRAGQEGWLEPLVTSHLTPCSVSQATTMMAMLPMPEGFRLRFRPTRGRARFNGKWYSVTLPNRGTRANGLRLGVVLHEAAHIIDHLTTKKFGHGDKFCRVLRGLLFNFEWRRWMPTTNMHAIYTNHRGPFSIMLVRETTAMKKGEERITGKSECLNGPYSAEEAHEEARMLVTDPRENVAGAYIYSLTEGQHIGAWYKRGETYRSWEEERDEALRNLGMEVALEHPEGALLQGGQEPVRSMDDLEPGRVQPGTTEPSGTVPGVRAKKQKPWAAPAKDAAPRKRGAALKVGKDESWPRSEAAQAVRNFFVNRTEATPGEIIEALGSKLNEMGVAHPASLVSRLKQAGFLMAAGA